MHHDPGQVEGVGAVRVGARLELALRDLVRQFPLKSEFTWSDAYPPRSVSAKVPGIPPGKLQQRLGLCKMFRGVYRQQYQGEGAVWAGRGSGPLGSAIWHCTDPGTSADKDGAQWGFPSRLQCCSWKVERPRHAVVLRSPFAFSHQTV